MPAARPAREMTSGQRVWLTLVAVLAPVGVAAIILAAITGQLFLTVVNMVALVGLLSSGLTILRQVQEGRAYPKSRRYLVRVALGFLAGFLILPAAGLALALSLPDESALIGAVSVALGASLFVYVLHWARRAERYERN